MLLDGKFKYQVFLLIPSLPLPSFSSPILDASLIAYNSPLPCFPSSSRFTTQNSATKASRFEGPGGPEEKRELYERENPGKDDVRGNVRQRQETRRP